MEITDEELVAEYLAGDEDTFGVLLKRHLRSVYSFAVRSVGDEAEDIVQDTWAKVWKNLKKYDSRSAKFKTWLMRIARNTVIDYLRRKKPYVFSDFENDDGDNRMEQAADEGPLPDELVARAAGEQEVREVLQELSPAHREVILLRYMSQLSFEEIGTVLAEPPNTVRSRHRRALIHLRHLLHAMHRD